MFWRASAFAVLTIAAFVGCMAIYEPIARIFLGVSACAIGFALLCWFDKYVLLNVNLYHEIVLEKNIALAIVLAAFVALLGAGFLIIS